MFSRSCYLNTDTLPLKRTVWTSLFGLICHFEHKVREIHTGLKVKYNVMLKALKSNIPCLIGSVKVFPPKVVKIMFWTLATSQVAKSKRELPAKFNKLKLNNFHLHIALVHGLCLPSRFWQSISGLLWRHWNIIYNAYGYGHAETKLYIAQLTFGDVDDGALFPYVDYLFWNNH